MTPNSSPSLSAPVPFPRHTTSGVPPTRGSPGARAGPPKRKGIRFLLAFLVVDIAAAGGFFYAAASGRGPAARELPALAAGIGFLALAGGIMLALALAVLQRWKRVRNILLAGAAVGVLAVIGFIATAWRRAAEYSLDAVLADPPRPALLALDGALYTHPDSGCSPVSSIDSIPLDLRQAVIAVEDIRFQRHHGVDARALFAAAAGTVQGKSRGGSTLLMQLIDNQFAHSRASGIHHRVWYKLVEVFAARRIFQDAANRFGSGEKARDAILLAYLNRVEFGRGQVGIAAAAHFWFQEKSPDRLALGDCAQLAGMLQNQRKYDPITQRAAAAERRRIVLQCMVAADFITEKEAAAARCSVDRTPERLRPLHDGFLPQRTQSELHQLHAAGLLPAAVDIRDPRTRIRLTIDNDKQAQLEDAVKSRATWIRRETERQRLRLSSLEAAAVVLRNEDASIAAMIGGLNHDAQQVDNLFSGFHLPASTLKPFIYAAELSRRPAAERQSARFFTGPLTRGETAPFLWRPANPSGLSAGWHSLPTVLAESDNWAAARTAWGSGREVISDKLSFLSLVPPFGEACDHVIQEPRYALGAYPCRLICLAAAARALAHDGLWRPAGLIVEVSAQNLPPTRIAPPQEIRVFPTDAARSVRSACHQTLVSGTASSLRSTLGRRAGTWAKTGTADNATDCLIIGGDSLHTVLIWFGRRKGDQPVLPKGSGGSICGPVLDSILR